MTFKSNASISRHNLPLFKWQMLQECLGELFQARLGIPPTGREASLFTLSQDQGHPSGDLQGTLPNCHGSSLHCRVHKPIRGLLSEEVSKAYFMWIIHHCRSKSTSVCDFFRLWLLCKFDKILFVSLRRSRDCLHVFLFVCPWLWNQDVERGSMVKCRFFPISEDVWVGWAPEVQRKAQKKMGESWIKFLWCFMHLLYRLWVRGAVISPAELLQNEKKQNWKNIYEKHKEWSAGVHLEQGTAGNLFL